MPSRTGAFGASLISHAMLVWLLYLLVTHPLAVRQLAESSHPAFTGMVFLNTPGAGGGGGGGGNRSPEPAHRLQTIGSDSMAIPIRQATPLTSPQDIPREQEPQPMALVMPVKPMDAGQLAQAGVIDNPNLAPTASRGPGDGGPGAGPGRGPGSGPGHGVGLGPGEENGIGGEYPVGGAVLAPVLLREVRPEYTADAMRARIQGEVLVSAVVLPDGSVGRVRVIRSLDSAFGLDEQALKAVRQWRFKPGMRFGQAVPVLIQIGVGFTMR